jgi:AbrB family looped-hinge helix DNA binding protein
MGPLPPMHSLSVATVGAKGQIVIPLEIRDELGINPGDKIVLLMRGKNAVVMLPMEGIQEWLDKLSADFDQIRTVVSESKDTKES